MRLADALESGIRHSVLNAKKHDEESQIIAGAGALGAVTIATNMAGRGVDIKLGGEIAEEVLAAANRVLRRNGLREPEYLNMKERFAALEGVDRSAIGIYESEVDLFRKFIQEEERVKEVGGLHVLGSERHESRRIDNQLRGRSARQGDPGSSQFFLSLEDELMRLFGGSSVSGLMERLNIDDGTPIAHGIVNRTIEQAQTRVEGANFDTRKHLLEYDDVLNRQREVYYGQRNRVFTKDDLTDDVEEMLRMEVERHVSAALSDPEGPWKLLAWLEETQPTLNLETAEPYPSFMLQLMLDSMQAVERPQDLKTTLLDLARDALETQKEHLGRFVEEQMDRSIERLDDQVKQRVDLVETAIEGAELEAQEKGAEPEPRDLIRIIEETAGMRLQTDAGGLERMRSDPSQFRKMIPDLVEASLGLRVWAGVLQSVERRMGEPLGLEASLQAPIDWDDASSRLTEAVDRVWAQRQEAILSEIDREFDASLSADVTVDEALKTRLLVQMSYGQRTFFDRRTHQKRAVMVARLAYPFVAARLLADAQPDELTDRVLEHLDKAEAVFQSTIGAAEIRRRAAASLAELEPQLKSGLQRVLGDSTYLQVESAGSLGSLAPALRDEVAQAIGRLLMSENFRGLILGVGDRLWVDYLTEMEGLRTSIGLEAYGQRDPLVQYKSKAFDMFQNLLTEIRSGVASRLFRAQQVAAPQASVAMPRPSIEEALPDQAAPASQPSDVSSRKKHRRRH